MAELPRADSPELPQPPDYAKDVGRRMAAGAAWMVLLRMVIRVIGLISTVILARLLTPQDFGLVVLATSLFGALEIMSELSFDMALIRDQKAPPSHYSTAWTMNLLKASIISGVLAFGAGGIAGYFEDERLELIIYFLAAATFLEGFQNIGIVDFRKHLEFKKEMHFSLAIRLVSFLITIILALVWRNYYALVFGIISMKITRVVLSYTMNPFRPKFTLEALPELFNFSKWLLINNLFLFINTKFDTFVIGKISGAESLGIYNVAYEISTLPTTELIWPISRAIYPGYAKISHDRPALQRAYLDVLGLMIVIAIPAAFGIALMAPWIVGIFLGDKWAATVPLIQILAVYGVIRVCFANSGSIYLAIGKPRIMAYLSLLNATLLVPLIPLLVSNMGATGAAYALIISTTVMFVANVALVSRHIDLPIARILAEGWRPFLGCLAMTGAVYWLQAAWPIERSFHLNVLQMVVLSALGALVYTTVVLGAWAVAGRPRGAEKAILNLLKRRLQRSIS